MSGNEKRILKKSLNLVSFNRRKLAGNMQMDRRITFMNKIAAPCDCLSLSRSYIHVYFHIIQTFSSLKSHGKSKPNFVSIILRKGEHVYINGLGHMTKMAAMAINSKNLKIFFSRTIRRMILKLGMKHRGMVIYTVYINHDHEMTLTYFTARLTKVVDVFVHSFVR